MCWHPARHPTREVLFPPPTPLAPPTHRLHHGHQALPPRRERVLDLRRNLWVDLSTHQPVRLHLPKLLRQHFLRDRPHLPLQLGEPPRAAQQSVQDHDLPPPADQGERGFGRAAVGDAFHRGLSVSFRYYSTKRHVLHFLILQFL